MIRKTYIPAKPRNKKLIGTGGSGGISSSMSGAVANSHTHANKAVLDLFKQDSDGNVYLEQSFYSLKDVSAFGKNNLGGGGDGVALTSWVDQITTLTDFNQNTKFIKQSEVVDNLTSNLSNLPLSARQGMILKNFIDNIEVGEGGQVVVDWDSILGKPSTFNPSAHTHVISDVTGLQIALDAKTSKTYVDTELAKKENSFTKNTAFNKNFGTTAGTVAQGNHTHTFASLTSKPTTLLGYGITDGAKSVDVDAHITDKANPHSVTKTQVGLSNVLNVKQATKVEFDTFKNFFDSLFELDGDYIKAKKSLYSTGDLSAFGKDNLGGGGTGGGTDLVSWVDQIMALTDFNVGSNFINIQQVEAKGYATNTRVDGINSRLTSVEGGSVMTVTTSGSGNAITSISKSGTVITATKGDTFSKVGHSHSISDITNLQTELNSKANNTIVNGISGRLTTVEANYTTQSDIDTAIDGIEIGGRNYAYIDTNIWGRYIYISNDFPRNGKQQMSLSLWGNFEGYPDTNPFYEIFFSGDYDIYFNDYTYIRKSVNHIVYEGGYVNLSLENDPNLILSLYGMASEGLITKVKIEIGNKATDWTPAPEDQVSDWLQSNESSFDYIKNKPTKLSQFSNVETDFTSKTYVTTELNKKVDKVTGKSLISDSEISRLSTVTNQTATSIGLGNVTNESKATMFTNPTFTGTTKVTVLELNTNWKFVKVGNNIELQYNGVTKQEMTSEGHIIAHGDVTAFG